MKSLYVQLVGGGGTPSTLRQKACKVSKICYNSDMTHHDFRKAFTLAEVFYPLCRSKRIAFTLAEVLITLGIIGIVAALTMPALIGKYQQKALISQLKKSYSTLHNTINLLNVENGVPYECYYSNTDGFHVSECNEFYEQFFKKLNIIKTCAVRDKGCRAEYKNVAQVLAEGGKQLNGACSHHVEGSIGYNLNDGSILYILSIESDNLGFNNQNATFIAVDVNGVKGPNRWGYDLFYLNLSRKNALRNVTLSTNLCQLVEKDGFSAEEIMLK